MTIFHSYLDKTTVMEKTTILNYKMKGASVAEWLESLTSNHLSLISSGSISGQGIKIFHVMKPSSWIREGRWLYQVPGRAWIMSGGQFGFSSNIKAWKIAMGHILCRCDSKPNPQKTQTKKKWKKYFHKIKFEKKNTPENAEVFVTVSQPSYLHLAQTFRHFQISQLLLTISSPNME